MTSPAKTPRRIAKRVILAIIVGSAFLVSAGAVTVVGSRVLMPAITNDLTASRPHREGAAVAAPTIAPTAGSNQTVPINTNFPIQLQIIVTESDVPQSGIEVTFTAPVDGAGGTFTGSNATATVTTDENGLATAPELTANGIAGSYQISAAIPEATTTFDLTNAKGDQTIDFAALPDKGFGDAPFEITATASSGLPVSFNVVSGPATINAQTLTITGAGVVTVRASQTGDDNYEAATPVDQTFNVAKADQTISFASLPNRTFGETDFGVSPTASSGLTVTITGVGHCTVNGLMVHLTGSGSCTLAAAQNGNVDYNAAPSVTRSFFIGPASGNQIYLTSFGTVGDGVADDGPALQRALDALANAGGGTLFVPPGRYAILTPVVRNFTGLTASVVIQGIESDVVVDVQGGPPELAKGLNLVSEFIPKTGTNAAIQLSGLHDLLIADIGFVGTPHVFNDAMSTLWLTDVDNATIYHCEFYGLSANGGGIIYAQRTGLRLEQSKFLGSFGASGTYTPNVQNVEWKSIVLSDVVFVDYGLRSGFYGKSNHAATFSWVNIGNAAAVTATSPRREAVFRNVFCDEGAFIGLTSFPRRHMPPSAPIDLIYISGMRMNVPNFGTTGHYFEGVQNVLIADSRYGWSHNAASAVAFSGASNVILDKLECVDHADHIVADAANQKLTVINSIYSQLESEAQITKVLTTQTPDEDPVQYVRQRFLSSLGRDPDAAAHFFWANKLLSCDENPQCVANEKQSLDVYLGSAPTPTFAINGQVTDETGSGLANVTIALTGSQSVTTLTDSSGNYSFNGLPTSGSYTLTPALTHYIFNPASQLIARPAGNQVVNFNAIIDRFTISGVVMQASGEVFAGVEINLTGSQTTSATTDASGAYSFTVPALGNYTVTPVKTHYTFSPTVTSFSALSGNRSASFVATLRNYTISGRVTDGGAALSGAKITVSGSAATTTTTDVNGNYSLTLVALGNYTLTPSLTHYTFAPAQLSFNNLSGNQTGNFAATPVNYTVSGRLTDGGAALSGATITVSGAAAATTTTDVNGNYSFTLVAQRNYTLTPSLTHYTFAPAQLSFNNLSGNQTGNFAATLGNYTISGRVTDGGAALSGATITVSGSAAATTTTDVNGNYSLTLVALGNYTLTPSLTHYTFAPAQLSFNNLSGNQTGNFAGTRNRHSISGSVMRSGGAGGVAEAIVTLSGATSATTTTSATGQFAFSNLSAGENYTVSAAKAHYVISPTNQTFNNLSSNQSANFTATPPVTINGRVMAHAAALSGATVALSGTESGSAVTDDSGNYSFTVAVGSYQVAVSKTHYSFSPQSVSLNNITTNQTGNFSGSLNRYQITGRVLNPDNSGLADVTVNLSGSQNGSALTDANGNFTFTALAAGGSYMITASDEDYTFDPSSKSFTDLSADQNVTVVGTPLPQLLLDPSGPDPNQAAAFDSLLFLRDPFPKQSLGMWFNLGADTNTRVLIFATNIRLNVGETASAVTVNLVDANSNSFDIAAEDVRAVPNSDVAQIRFKLPNEINAGLCTVKVRKDVGPFSNAGTFRVDP